jgi:hypothetical protein
MTETGAVTGANTNDIRLTLTTTTTTSIIDTSANASADTVYMIST